jgi:S-adenosylmethionine decarboxylase
MQPSSHPSSNKVAVVMPGGTHLIAELAECDREALNDEEFLRERLREAAHTAGATVLSIHSHKFTPVGVTAFALLAESHISIHTWPELKYAAVDAFTCGQAMRTAVAIESVARALDSKNTKVITVNRGL